MASCSTSDRNVFEETLRMCCEVLSLRLATVLELLKLTRCFKFFQSQKSHRLRSEEDQREKGSGKCRLTTRSSLKCFFRASTKQRLICGKVLICIKSVRERPWHASIFDTILFFNNDEYCCPAIEHFTGQSALKSSKKYEPGMKDAANP